MKTYGDIINRIAEIIANSQEMQKTDTNPQNYTHLLYNDIYKDYVSELRDLLDIERTFSILLKSSEDETVKKNLNLLNLCEAKIKANDPNVNDYITLMEIIKSSFGKTPSEIIEYAGYFINKEQFTNFLDLCRKLKIGPCIKLNELTGNVAKNEIYKFLSTKTEQYKRITNYIHASARQPEKSLVSIINNWNLFTNEELQVLKQIETNAQALDNIDILLAFLKTKQNITIEFLKTLKQYLGESDFNYFIDELYKQGSISPEYYSSFIDEYIKELDLDSKK